MNSRCPSVPTVIEVITTTVDLIETTKELEGNASIRDQS